MANQPVARDTMDLASVKTVNDAAMYSKTIIDDMEEVADQAHTSLTGILEDALEAHTWAGEANTAATGALTGLSTVQDVIGMLNWAAENATYSLTQDTDIMPGKTYWTRSGAGTAADPYVYMPVVNPVKTALSTYYEITGVNEAMGDFINAHLALTEEGLWILPDGMDAQSYRVLIATGGQGHTYEDAGTYIIDSTGKTVAKLGEDITLGSDNNTESFLQLDYHSMRLVDKEDNPYLYISDLRDKDDNWQATIEEKFIGDGQNKEFTVQFSVSSEISATDSSDVSNTARRNGKTYTFTNKPADGATVTITYKTTDSNVKAYTLGMRGSGRIGAMSLAEGSEIIASGPYSHAEGENTTASGHASHAEGTISEAKGYSAHAEGSSSEASGPYSHAEGENTTASGHASHAEGMETTAYGYYSHAEGRYVIASGFCAHASGEGTTAQRAFQTVIGAYNKEDTNGADTSSRGKYIFIIGNGDIDGPTYADSNALTVDWHGNVDIASGAKYKINGTNLSASDVSALPISGGTITGNLSVQGSVNCDDYSGNLKSIFDIFYPVGSYYETSDANFDPEVAWGGTWILETAGLVHVSGAISHANYPVSSTCTDANNGAGQQQGGDEEVTLTTDQIPAHTHGSSGGVTNGITGGSHHHTNYRNKNVASGSAVLVAAASSSSNGLATTNETHTHNLPNHTHSSVGKGESHNNMQPYINVYRWHRTA